MQEVLYTCRRGGEEGRAGQGRGGQGRAGQGGEPRSGGGLYLSCTKVANLATSAYLVTSVQVPDDE